MNEDSFYSVNRLVDFGMSLAVAQQMSRSMNTALDQMQVPGAMNPIGNPPARPYYAILQGNTVGPFSEKELSRLIVEKKVDNETYLWRYGMSKWQKAADIPDVVKLVLLMPPPFTEQN